MGNLDHFWPKVIPQQSLPGLSPQLSSHSSAELTLAKPLVQTDPGQESFCREKAEMGHLGEFLTVVWVTGTQLKPSTPEGCRPLVCLFGFF